MIAISHYRVSGGSRHAVSAAGDVQSIAKGYTPTQASWGTFTSARPAPLSPADIALIAFRTGVKPSVLKKAIALGLFHDG